MDGQARYAISMFFLRTSAEVISGWIEEPHLLQPVLVGSGPADYVDRQTNKTAVNLALAVWRTPTPLLGGWPVELNLPKGPLWLLTTWSRDPAVQHLLRALAVTEDLAPLVAMWPEVVQAIPLDSEWLTDRERSLLVMAAVR